MIVARLTKLCISLLYHILRGAFCRGAPRAQQYHKPTVLTYHSVRESQREKFAKQMDDLLSIGHAVAADSAGSALSSRRNIAVTFDDAFQSILANALPALHQRGIPAAIFVPAGYMGKKPGWIHDSQHVNMGETVLSEEELRSLDGTLVMIGSHGMNHRKMTELDEKMAAEELTGSKKKLEAVIGKTIGLFALPYGDYDSGVMELCKKAGYERVFLNIPVADGPGNVYGRIDISADDWRIEYRLKMAGSYRWLYLAIKLKRRMMCMCRKAVLRPTARSGARAIGSKEA